MPCVPKIDRPCPLASSAGKVLAGYCHVCDKMVHNFDGMDTAARRALVQNASGPICVSYRISAGLSAALALSMASTPATARDPAFELGTPPASSSSVLSEALREPGPSGDMSPVSPSAPAERECEEASEALEELEFIGGVSRPGEVEWIEDDSSLPDLPIRPEFPQHAG